jgi:uncharacterized repeat protein (TIGR01451 family)
MFVKSRSSGSSIDAELKDFIAPAPVQVTNCPTPDIATQTSVSSMTVGDTQTVGDTATLTNGNSPTGDVTFTLYSDPDCQDATAVTGSATLSGGVATFAGASFTPTQTGTYYWGATYPGDDQNNAASACGGDNEEIVVNPASPNVTTTADPASAVIGSADLTSVSDTATFTDGFQLDGRDATFTLYSDSSCDPADATTVTGTATISGGSATFAGDASGLAVGTYYWGVSLPADANNDAVSECGGDEGVENEVLSIEKASPQVTTVADPSSAVAGPDASSVSDTATFTDGFQLDGRDATFTLYGDQFCNPADATSVTGTATISGGSATFTGDASALPAGTYYWGVSLAADASNNAVSECGGDEGVENEVLSIEKASPQVTTVADPSAAGVGSDASSVSDTATFTDGFQLDGRDAAFTLYSDPSCDPADATSVAGSATISDGSATFTGDASALPAGTYYWGVSLPADDNNNAVSECGGDEGVENEVLSIGQASPTIATTLSESAGSHGDKVHDSAKLSGATGHAGGTVTYSVYSDSSCTTKVADGGTVTVTNGSVPNSNDVTFNTPGTYYWQASYSGDTNNQPALSTCTDEKLVIAPLIDLAVTKVGSPDPITIGKGDITWTMVVTNNGPDTATGVKIADPLPAGTTFVSVSPSKGSCTGGAIISCSLGTMAAGETVTITLVTTPTVEGTVSNTVTVVGNEQETNTANNTATASVVVKGFTPPPVFCVAVSKVTPSQLFVGRKTKLTIHVTQHGKAVKGIRVLIKGPKLNMRTGASNANGVITTRVKLKKSGIAIFSPIASKRCNTKRVGITGVFTPPVTG